MRLRLKCRASWLALAVIGLLPASLPAQIASQEEVTNLYNKHRGRFEEILGGKSSFDPKADQEVVLRVAHWYVQRMFWDEKLPAAVAQFDAKMKQVAPLADKEFLSQWSNALVVSFKGVLKLDFDDKRTVLANLALMLPALARAKQDVVGDYFAELIRDDKSHDVIKLGALKGMREFFPVQAPLTKDNDNALSRKKQARDIARIDAVTSFIARKPNIPANASKEMIDAFIYLRREAVRALALAQMPAIAVEKKNETVTKVDGPIAYQLLRILLPSDADQPLRFSLAEKCEAAVGTAQLRMQLVDGYRPDVAVFLLGNFLVEFINAYRTDFQTFALKSADKDLRKIPLLAWKVHADQIEKALGEMRKNAPATNTKLLEDIDRLLRESRPSLNKIKSYSFVDQPTLLERFVPTLAPKDGSVYGDLAEYRLQLRGAPD